MNDQLFSGEALEKALQEGSLNQPQALLTGMVKPSGTSGNISFSPSGCDMWVDLPTGMVKHAEHIGQRGCRDHVHPMVRITLHEPKNPEGRVLLALLAQATPNPSSDMPVGGAFHAVQLQGDTPPHEAFIQSTPMMTTSRSSFGGFGGFGGFGPTLPSCRWVKKLVVCGSAIPGYPVPMCWEWVYCCTWPNGATGCM